MASLLSRVVLVTGSSGIGGAGTEAFARTGAPPYVTGHSLIVDGGMTASMR
jgi:NAD(P)-dependent dehydrogenase (short-subunit alcohol dehydrogenase family)